MHDSDPNTLPTELLPPLTHLKSPEFRLKQFHIHMTKSLWYDNLRNYAIYMTLFYLISVIHQRFPTRMVYLKHDI